MAAVIKVPAMRSGECHYVMLTIASSSFSRLAFARKMLQYLDGIPEEGDAMNPVRNLTAELASRNAPTKKPVRVQCWRQTLLE